MANSRKKAKRIGPHARVKKAKGCKHCGGWHDRSSHWSHEKGPHAKGPRGGSWYKPKRKGKTKPRKPAWPAGPRGYTKKDIRRVRPSVPAAVRPRYPKTPKIAIPRSVNRAAAARKSHKRKSKSKK